MLTSKVAKRYAQGLIDFSQEAGLTESVFSEMQDVVKILDTSKELRSFFASPIIDGKKKIGIASEIFKDFSPVSKNIISLVIKQGRETHLRDIAQEFINKVEQMRGIQKVTLTTASQLSQSNIDEILKSSHLVNDSSKFSLSININPDILEEYILRVGDQQIDASVKSKLNNIRKEFQLN
ncbi:ATP synthase F1 subunit delta [Bergeyella porcorum]|uniref:ATP synthase subunit delta n=1 Tax=Bergeyella porcorum TaxID=1735111 RepID=A0AAU0F185_9FLAO